MNTTKIFKMLTVLALGTIAPLLSTDVVAKQRPNIILMVADDMGWGEIGSYGGSKSLTPNLTKLSESGIRFDQFYAAGSVCTPTRISILTGRYPHRFGMFNAIYRDKGGNMPASATTLAEILKNDGYATAHMGKWHLGGVRGIDAKERLEGNADADPGPHQHGFDDYQTQIEDSGERWDLVKQGRLYRDGGTILLRNEKRVPKTDPYYSKHWEDCNADYAIEAIDKLGKGEKPFFINLWWYIPHKPIEPSPEPFMTTATQDPRTNERAQKKGSKTEYSSMIAHLDHNVGKVVKKLETSGLLENTIIIFTSDNGGAWGGFNGGLTGGKGCYFEGGIRVPNIVSWKGKIKPGTSTDFIGHTNDLLPTICDLAEVEIPDSDEIDGISLAPTLLESNEQTDRGLLYWASYKPGRALRDAKVPFAVSHVVRAGNWKLCWLASKDDGKSVALFNIKSDPKEADNLINNPEYQEVVQRLEKSLLSHLKEKFIPAELKDNKRVYILE